MRDPYHRELENETSTSAVSRGAASGSLRERLRVLERIRTLVAEESDPVLGLCSACAALTSQAVQKQYAWHQYEISKFVKEDFRTKADVNIFGVLDESDHETREQIRQAHADLEAAAAAFAKINSAIEAEVAAIEELGRHRDVLTRDLNELELRKECLHERAQAVVDLTASAERELRMLHALDTVPLFYISNNSSPPRINGFALTLYPSRSDSYADINTAWALIGLAAASVISIQFPHDQAPLAAEMNYKISPLRNRVILRRIKYIAIKNSPEPTAFLGPVLSLEGGVSETYLEAIAALLVLVASLARMRGMTGALVGTIRRVLDTMDKYGADVASSSFGGGFQHSRDKVSGSLPGTQELLPHWRYLFTSSGSMTQDLMQSLQNLL